MTDDTEPSGPRVVVYHGTPDQPGDGTALPPVSITVTPPPDPEDS